MRKRKENDHVDNNTFPNIIYLFKVNKRNTIKKCETCSKLKIKTPERHWRRSAVFDFDFDVVDFEQVNVIWVHALNDIIICFKNYFSEYFSEFSLASRIYYQKVTKLLHKAESIKSRW